VRYLHAVRATCFQFTIYSPNLFAVAWFPLVLCSVLKHFEAGRCDMQCFASLFSHGVSCGAEILMMSVLLYSS